MNAERLKTIKKEKSASKELRFARSSYKNLNAFLSLIVGRMPMQITITPLPCVDNMKAKNIVCALGRLKRSTTNMPRGVNSESEQSVGTGVMLPSKGNATSMYRKSIGDIHD